MAAQLAEDSILPDAPNQHYVAGAENSSVYTTSFGAADTPAVSEQEQQPLPYQRQFGLVDVEELSPTCHRAMQRACRWVVGFLRIENYGAEVCNQVEDALLTSVRIAHVERTRMWTDQAHAAQHGLWAQTPCMRCVYHNYARTQSPFYRMKVPAPEVHELGEEVVRFVCLVVGSVADGQAWSAHRVMGAWNRQRTQCLMMLQKGGAFEESVTDMRRLHALLKRERLNRLHVAVSTRLFLHGYNGANMVRLNADTVAATITRTNTLALNVHQQQAANAAALAMQRQKKKEEARREAELEVLGEEDDDSEADGDGNTDNNHANNGGRGQFAATFAPGGIAAAQSPPLAAPPPRKKAKHQLEDLQERAARAQMHQAVTSAIHGDAADRGTALAETALRQLHDTLRAVGNQYALLEAVCTVLQVLCGTVGEGGSFSYDLSVPPPRIGDGASAGGVGRAAGAGRARRGGAMSGIFGSSDRDSKAASSTTTCRRKRKGRQGGVFGEAGGMSIDGGYNNGSGSVFGGGGADADADAAAIATARRRRSAVVAAAARSRREAELGAEAEMLEVQEGGHGGVRSSISATLVVPGGWDGREKEVAVLTTHMRISNLISEAFHDDDWDGEGGLDEDEGERKVWSEARGTRGEEGGGGGGEQGRKARSGHVADAWARSVQRVDGRDWFMSASAVAIAPTLTRAKYTPCCRNRNMHTGLTDRRVLPEPIKRAVTEHFSRPLGQETVCMVLRALSSSATCLVTGYVEHISNLHRISASIEDQLMVARNTNVAMCVKNMTGAPSYAESELARALHDSFETWATMAEA